MRKHDAFTLLECVAVVFISALLLMTIVPATRDMLWRSNSNTEINRLASLLHYARMEAMELNLAVSICPSKDSKHCGGQWQDGMLIFTDPDASGEAADKQILRVVGALQRGAQLVWQGFTGENFINIPPTVLSSRAAGSFVYCPEYNYRQYAQQLVINRVGRVRVSHTLSSEELSELCQATVTA